MGNYLISYAPIMGILPQNHCRINTVTSISLIEFDVGVGLGRLRPTWKAFWELFNDPTRTHCAPLVHVGGLGRPTPRTEATLSASEQLAFEPPHAARGSLLDDNSTKEIPFWENRKSYGNNISKSESSCE